MRIGLRKVAAISIVLIAGSSAAPTERADAQATPASKPPTAPRTADGQPVEPYELNGDRLGMSLVDFKAKYARPVKQENRSAPLCSDSFPGRKVGALSAEPWNTSAGIVKCRTHFPSEESPMVAGVKTKVVLHEFVDGKLYNIYALFSLDRFEDVKKACLAKYGKPSGVRRETYHGKFRETEGDVFTWDNTVSKVTLAERGGINHTTLVLAHTELTKIAESRTPAPPPRRRKPSRQASGG
jgi:hypothetical protein